MTDDLTFAPQFAPMASRAVLAVTGPDARSFLQGLLTQDVEGLGVGELRFGALLTPQGRLMWDLFLLGREDGVWLDVEASAREAIVQRLSMYRLRAKVEIAALDIPVAAVFPTPAHPREGGDPSEVSHANRSVQTDRPVWVPAFAGMSGVYEDPRHPALGLRCYGAERPERAQTTDETAYDAHRIALGAPGPADWAGEGTYPIEANFDLLNGIDFHKGCFVGQETTSRMKRRGTIKSRMLPIAFDGPAPAPGTEILNGELRAGEVLSGRDGRAIALLRLDRLDGDLTAGGRTVRAWRPAWMSSE